MCTLSFLLPMDMNGLGYSFTGTCWYEERAALGQYVGINLRIMHTMQLENERLENAQKY